MHPKVHLQPLWFAAGIAVVLACIERAVVKQWRVLVFLALNLLLIAILFTSTHPPHKSNSDQKNVRKSTSDDWKIEDQADDGLLCSEDDGQRDDVEKCSTLMSDEELNEKVEAFISKFKKEYLVSDVEICRNRSLNVTGDRVFLKTITV